MPVKFAYKMRIIAGTNRGMKLFSPPGLDSRPIIDRVKQSLFDVLQKYDLPEGKVVADVFAGVGSLGLEALSRGAAYVSFIENGPKIVSVLKQNIEKAGFTEKSKIIRVDAFKVQMPFDNEHPIYDLIFVDPPYVNSAQTQLGSPLATLLCRLADCVKPESYVVVRTRDTTTLSQAYASLKIIERRQWGTMAISILRNNTDGHGLKH
jgi:16S rRNA (guanine966-N2)-methyltransferase